MIGGAVLGRLGSRTAPRAPRLLFEVRPGAPGAPRIGPKPILDGWKLLDSTALYRAAGKNLFFGRDAANPPIAQLLMLSKEALMRRVLADPRSIAASSRPCSTSPPPASSRRSPP